MIRTILLLVLLLWLNGSLAAASMPNAECDAGTVCTLDLRLLTPPPPRPLPPVLPASTEPLPPAPPASGGAQ